MAEEIHSTHIPYHLLCKSHTCERLDQDNLVTLSDIENKIKVRNQLVAVEPRLSSFLGQSKCIAEAALTALLKLVAADSDGKTIYH